MKVLVGGSVGTLNRFVVVVSFCLAVGGRASEKAFSCIGRMGAFRLAFAGNAVEVTGADGSACRLPRDPSFRSEERSYFQVLGAYDRAPKEIRDLNIPELISPDGYLMYQDREGSDATAECSKVFGGQDFRKFYLRSEMLDAQPSHFGETVINVFKSSKGFVELYLNYCVQSDFGFLQPSW